MCLCYAHPFYFVSTLLYCHTVGSVTEILRTEKEKRYRIFGSNTLSLLIHHMLNKHYLRTMEVLC